MTHPVDQFLSDLENGEEGFAPADSSDQQSSETGGLPEKYQGKSAEEVYRLLTQEQQFNQQRQQEQREQVEIPPFDRDKSVADYGEDLTSQFEAAGINPYEVDARVRAGEEISADVIEKIAAAAKVPPPMAERYIKSFAPNSPAAAATGVDNGLQQRMVEALGGAENAQAISAWADRNAPQDVNAFNDAMRRGEEAKALQILLRLQRGASASSTAGPRSPGPLIRGTGGGSGSQFLDQSEVEESLYRRNPVTGRRFYEESSRYRRAHDQKVLRSNLYEHD